MSSQQFFSCGSDTSKNHQEQPMNPEAGNTAKAKDGAAGPAVNLGRKLGAYRITAQCGTGGYAHVYQAKDEAMNRTVALKVLRPEIANKEGFLERFNDEVRTIANLEHSNILPVYNYGKEEGQVFLAMRFIGSGSLADKLKGGKTLPLKEAFRVVTQVGKALDHAHAHGVIHRDVKPENIMIDASGNCLLTDFGISKVEGSDGHTAAGQVLGSVNYMSPEQCKGERLDNRTDLYALGVIFYQMLVGALPFQASTHYATMSMHVNRQAAFPDGNDLAPRYRALILRALAKAPGERFQSGKEMAAALHKAIRGETAPEQREATMPAPNPGHASRHSRSDAIKSSVGRNIRLCLSAIVCGIIIGAAVFLASRSSTSKPAAVAESAQDAVPTPMTPADFMKAFLQQYGKPPARAGLQVVYTLHDGFTGDNPEFHDIFMTDVVPLINGELNALELQIQQGVMGDLSIEFSLDTEPGERIPPQSMSQGESFRPKVHLKARLIAAERPSAVFKQVAVRDLMPAAPHGKFDDGTVQAFREGAETIAKAVAAGIASWKDQVNERGTEFTIILQNFRPQLEVTGLDQIHWFTEVLREMQAATGVRLVKAEAGEHSREERQVHSWQLSFAGDADYLRLLCREAFSTYHASIRVNRPPNISVDNGRIIVAVR